MNTFLLLFILAFIREAITISVIPGSSEKKVDRIAFGSCNDYWEDQRIWQSIREYDPDLWIWLGDVVYNDNRRFLATFDTSPPDVMKQRYDAQKNNTEYKKLNNKTPMIGIWDDHDYGINDGDMMYQGKDRSQQLFLDFLDEPDDSPRRSQKGLQGSWTFGKPGQRTKILLLDTRYFKTPADTALTDPGDLIGEHQWQWLESEMNQGDADLYIIGSGIQILAFDKPLQEKWGNYPLSRTRLLEIIQKSDAKNVLMISGDVHYAEILSKGCKEMGSDLVEITSSGMTHSCVTHLPRFLCHFFLSTLLKSVYMESQFVELNWGSLEIDWQGSQPIVKADIRGVDGNVAIGKEIRFEQGRPTSCTEDPLVAAWRLLPRKILLRNVAIAVIIGLAIIIRFFKLYPRRS